MNIRIAILTVLLLSLLTPAWSAEKACAVCSVEQSRLHLESCELSQEWQGKTYHFCQQACQQEFLKEPEKWAKAFALLSEPKEQAEKGSVAPS